MSIVGRSFARVRFGRAFLLAYNDAVSRADS